MSTSTDGDTAIDAANAPLTHQQLYAYLIRRYESNPRLNVYDMADFCVTHHAQALQDFIDQELQRCRPSGPAAGNDGDNADDDAPPNSDHRPLHLTLERVAIEMVEAALMTAFVNRKVMPSD